MSEKLDTHYKKASYEPIVFIERFNLNFSLGNVIKYITRHKHKNKQKDIQRIMEFYYPHIMVNIPFHSHWDAKFTVGEILDELDIFTTANGMIDKEKEILIDLFKYVASMDRKYTIPLMEKIAELHNKYNEFFK